MIKLFLVSLLSLLTAAEQVGVYFADSRNSTSIRLIEDDMAEAGFKYLRQCGKEWGVRFFHVPWVQIDTLQRILEEADNWISTVSEIVYEHVPEHPDCQNDPMLNRTGYVGFNVYQGKRAARIALVNESSDALLAGVGGFELKQNISDVGVFGPFEKHGSFKRADTTPLVHIYGFHRRREIEEQKPVDLKGITAMCEGSYRCIDYFQGLLEANKTSQAESLLAEANQTIEEKSKEIHHLESEHSDDLHRIDVLLGRIKDFSDIRDQAKKTRPKKLTREWCQAHPAFSLLRVFGLSVMSGHSFWEMLMCQMWDNPGLVMFIFHPLKDWDLFKFGY